MSTPADTISHAASDLGVIAFRGPDAAKFLQGQLSAEIEKLATGAGTLAGLHNPQGRVVALLNISRATPEEFRAVLPRDLVSAVMARLGKYVLRAKVRIVDATGEPGALPEPVAERELLEIRAGLPQVYAATSETFVAQMLNLDLLGAIAFDKGCYTGQEVIARAHYRGKVKRRMQRWLNTSGIALKPADAARGPGGLALVVVRAAPPVGGQQDQGSQAGWAQEILAVGNFAAAAEPAEAQVPAGSAESGSAGVPVSGPLPLPYTLPA